jgi:selenocysteine lyase/cysteine desulfurase
LTEPFAEPVAEPSPGPIHLNTAGAGRLPAAAVAAMAGYSEEEARTGSYETELRHERLLTGTLYEQLGRLVNAAPQDVALFDSATRAWCAVVLGMRFSSTDRVWVTPYEYAGNLIALRAAQQRYAFRLEVIPLLPSGDLDLDWVAAQVDSDVALVSAVHIPSGCGVVLAVEALGTLLRPWRCRYVVDACQAVGQLRVDVARIGCDVLTAAGRKFLCGPRGTGFAYISERVWSGAELPFYDLHVAAPGRADQLRLADQSARVYEYAERNNAALTGLSAALDVLPEPDGSALALAGALREELAALPGIRLLCPGTVQSGIVTFVPESVPPAPLVAEMRRRGINVWNVHGWHTPIFMAEQGVDTAVRVSVHHYNTEEHIDSLVRALAEVVDG